MAEVFYFHVQEDRSIKYKPTEPIMQEDKDVAVWRFRIPKVLNNIDMSAWAWWFVYANAKNQKFSELLTLTNDIDDPENYCTADYSIGYGISKTPGGFTFALEAINAEQGGEIDGEWHTRTYTHTVTPTLQGNQAEYAETESDIISELLIEVRNKVNQLVGGATPTPVASVSAMTDPSKLYLLTTDGNWYYHNGTTFVSGGVYGAGVVDSVPTQGSNNAVRSGGVWSALSDKVAKPLTSPNGTNGQILRTLGNGQTEWVDVGTPTDAQVGTAVESWLDDHPEATTTVQDGSLTEAKFSDALKLKTIKDYVTPEMFGAVGDGVNDDTQAIQNALDSSVSFVQFSNKTYKISGVNITTPKTIIFNNTTFYPVSTYQEYLVKIGARVVTMGWVCAEADNKALFGFYITSNASRSRVDYLRAHNCLVYGVYLDYVQLMELGHIAVTGCGTKVSTTSIIERLSETTFSVNKNTYVFRNYMENAIIVDASDYHIGWDGSAIPWNSAWIAKSYEESDNASGIITLKSLSHNKIQNTYTGQRNAYVLIGGGIGCGGSCRVNYINSMNNAVGIVLNRTNRNLIDFMYSQSDGIPIATPDYNIGSMVSQLGVEGAKTGMHVYAYNYMYLQINSREDWSVDSSTVGGNNDPVDVTAISVFSYDAAKRTNPRIASATVTNITVKELFSDNSYFTRVDNINIGLDYVNPNFDPRNERTSFGVKTIYIGKTNGETYGMSIAVKLTSALITAGYTLKGGTDGVLTIDCTNDTFFTIKIIKVGSVFLVSKEAHNVIT